MFHNYTTIVPKPGYETKHGKKHIILTLKQILQRLTKALAQVKAGKTSETLLNEICQIKYIICTAKKKFLKKYITI